MASAEGPSISTPLLKDHERGEHRRKTARGLEVSALRHRRQLHINDSVKRLDRMALKSIGVVNPSGAASRCVSKRVSLARVFCSVQHLFWNLTSFVHWLPSFLSLTWCSFMWKGTTVLFFRLADGRHVKADERPEADLPQRLSSIHLTSVEPEDDCLWEYMLPEEFDKTGWISWKIPQELCDQVSKECKVDVSFLLHKTLSLSETFHITCEPHDLGVPEDTENFNFSYPYPGLLKKEWKDIDGKTIPSHEHQVKITQSPTLALLANGGFMYYRSNTLRLRREKRKLHHIPWCCISYKQLLFDLVHVKAVTLRSLGRKGDLEMKFGLCQQLTPVQSWRMLANIQKVSIPALLEKGLTHFKWIAPQESFGHEYAPVGYPRGGFCYVVTNDKAPNLDEKHQTSVDQEQGKLRSEWWNLHVDELKKAVVEEHQKDKGYKTQVLTAIERLNDHSDSDWKNKFQRAQLYVNSIWQLRYAFRVPFEESAPIKIYYVFFAFRLTFALVMTLLLTTAAFLGFQMQIFFTVFGDAFKQDQFPSVMVRVFFCCLPLLTVLFAIIFDQLWDLVCDSLSPPCFGLIRAKMLAVLGKNNVYYKPTFKACLFVDALSFLGAEVLPDIGFMYNYISMWYNDTLPHWFFMGHEGTLVAVMGGYVSGHFYFCLGITIIMTVVDTSIAIGEYFAPAGESIRWPIHTIQHALQEHNVRPYYISSRSGIFQKAFYQGETMTETGVLDSTTSSPVSSELSSTNVFHVHTLDGGESVSKVWQLLLLLFIMVPWLIVCYYFGALTKYGHLENLATRLHTNQWINQWIDTDSQQFEQTVVDGFVFFACVSLTVGAASLSFELKRELPNLIGGPFFFALALALVFELLLLSNGQGFRGDASAASTSMGPIMSLVGNDRAPHGGLPTSWSKPAGTQRYPVCRMGWGARSAQVSSLELGALSWISYASNCSDGNSSVSALLNQSFSPAPELVMCNKYSEIPRWIAVRFRGENVDDDDTIVVVVKGTSTVVDGYLDTDLYTTIEVLQKFSFVAPLLRVVPTDMVVWMLAKLKTWTVGGGAAYEQRIWGGLISDLRSLQSNNSRSSFVLTGHSLGGAIAEIAAGQLGIPALVWSAPGSKYLQRFFNITEEEEQRDVVVIIPDFDVVPRVDKHPAVVQRIQCWGKNHQVENPLVCHSIAKSTCEVWRVCGDEKKRNFTTTCSQFISEKEIGVLYPVLHKPIIAS